MGSRSSGVPASVYETTPTSCSRTRDFDSLHVPSHKRRSGMCLCVCECGGCVWCWCESGGRECGVCVCGG